MAMRSVEEEIERMSWVRMLIWSTLRLFSMASFRTDIICSVRACTASISCRADCSIVSERPRISTEYRLSAALASVICRASSWVRPALVVMADVFREISPRAPESCSVSPESLWALPEEVSVRPRILPTTRLSDSELS